MTQLWKSKSRFWGQSHAKVSSKSRQNHPKSSKVMPESFQSHAGVISKSCRSHFKVSRGRHFRKTLEVVRMCRVASVTAFLTAAIWDGQDAGMKVISAKALGQYIVSDPGICRGRPTFKGTRVTVAAMLADVEQGLSWDFIAYRWGDGKIDRAAIAEAVQLAHRALLTREGQLVDDAAAA
jgi:uncharacterized protein (DUF433 family)